MKTIVKIVLPLVLCAAFCSCSESERHPEFTSFTVVNFMNETFSVNEDTVQFNIPIQVYPKVSGDVTVTVKVLDGGTATKGTDFTIDNEVISFSTDDETNVKNVVVKVVNHAGIFTNTLAFSLGISDVVGDNVHLGVVKEASVTIKDLDHPLSAILGEYTMSGVWFYASAGKFYTFTEPVKFSTDKDNAKKVWISPISPMLTIWEITEGTAAVYGIVSDDLKTIKIPYGQKCSYVYDGETTTTMLLETVLVVGDEGSAVDFIEPEEGAGITFTLLEGDEVTGTVFGSNDDWDLWDLSEGGAPTYSNTPVCGNKWAPFWGAESQTTKLTKK